MFENDILVGCRLFHVGNLTRCAVGTQVVSGMSRMSVLANGSSSDISRRTWPQSMREIWPISNNYRCVYTSRVSVEISFRSHWGQGEVDDLTTEAEVCVRCIENVLSFIYTLISRWWANVPHVAWVSQIRTYRARSPLPCGVWHSTSQ